MDGDYGVRWTQWNRRGELVTRERFFATAKARESFATRLEMKPTFNTFSAWSGPRGEAGQGIDEAK